MKTMTMTMERNKNTFRPNEKRMNCLSNLRAMTKKIIKDEGWSNEQIKEVLDYRR